MENSKLIRKAYTRLNEEEAKRWLKYCVDNNVKRGRMLRKLIRECVTNKPDLVGPQLLIFQDAVRESRVQGKNLNQLVKHLNMGGKLIEPDLKKLISDHIVHVQKIELMLQDILTTTRNRTV